MSTVESVKKIEETPKKHVVYWAKVLITLFFMFGFGYLPPWEPLGQLGMQVLGIFMGLLFAWSFIGFIWPSLLAILALGCTSYTTVGGAFKAGFGDSTTLFILLILIFAGYLDHSGLSSKLAYWFLSRKSAVGHPWRFTLLIYLAAYVLCIAIHIYATIFLLWSIFYNICDLVGYKKGDKYPTVVCMGIVVCAGLGYAALPIKAVPIMIIGAIETASAGAITIDFMTYATLSVVITFMATMMFFVVTKYIVRPDVTPLMKIKESDFAEHRGVKWTLDEKIAIGSVLAFVILMFLPSILPKTNALAILLKNLGMNGCITLVMIVLVVCQLKGKSIMEFSKAANSGSISWDMVIMFAGTMPVAAAMSNPEVGVQKFIMHFLNPIFEGMGPVMFSVAILVITCLLTQVTHNVVLAVVMTPIMYHFAMQTGANPVMLGIYLNFALGIAFMTPAASAPAALMFLNTEWIGIKQCYWIAAVHVAISMAVLICVGLPFGFWFFQ